MAGKKQLLSTKSANQLASRQYVYAQLLDDYPAKAVNWVKTVTWDGPQVVPLDSFDFSNADSWNASSEPAKVEKFAGKIQDGQLKPILAVQKPGSSALVIIDGHHRALAYKKLGRDPLAWVGHVPATGGPWDEMHASQRSSLGKKS
jgi:hypothetical protein